MDQELIPSIIPGTVSFWNRLPGEVARALRCDWPYLSGILGLFGLGVWWGATLQLANPDLSQKLFQIVMEQFRELLEALQGAPLYKEILLIWFNNLTASAGAVLAGLLFPVFPLLFIFGNGAVVGLFQEYLTTANGFSAGQFYLSLMPHGIFELTAVFIAAWVGIRAGVVWYGFIGRLIWKGLTGKVKTSGCSPVEYFKSTARYYLVVVVIMLLVAATIEVTISPLLLVR